MKLTGKRGKIYRQLLKEGKDETYARRISKKLAEGLSLKQARGMHKKERYRKLPKTYQPAPRGRLDSKKEEWTAYAYVDAIQEGRRQHTYFSMTSRDITKTQYKNYEKKGEQEALYRVHQFLEQELNEYLIHEKLQIITSDINELHVDTYHKKLSKRRFEFEVVDLITEVVRFFLLYEKGKIRKSQLWIDFPITEFQLIIADWAIWN